MIDFPASPASIHTLDNGLTVIIDSSVEAAVVSCQFWVQTGSMHEFPLLGSGISHLLEHMVFKGTEKYSSESLGQTVQAAGGQWNAYTTFDRTVYYIDGPSQSTSTFLDVLSEMMFRPTFDTEEFTSERDVIRREIDMGLDSADSQNAQLLFSTLYQRDARRHPVIGHLDLFNAITLDDMVDYHARRYSPRNMFVVIAGQVDDASILEQLTSLTPETSTRFDDQPILPIEPRQMGRRVNRKNFAVHASHLTLSWQAPEMSHPDAPALDLLATILGAGRSSILYRRLREKRELCLHIGASSWLPAHGPGLFAISAEVPADGRDSLEAAIISTLEDALSEPLDDLIKKAQRMMLTSQFRTLTTASGRASDLASNWNEARNLDFTRDYLASLNAVTAEDILQAAKRWLTPSTLSITSLDPESSAQTTSQTSAKKSVGNTLSTHTLSNGMRVVLGQDKRLPLVNLCTASLAGSISETPGTNGINTLLASLLDKGTPTTSAEDLATLLDEHGARFSATSGNNSFLTQAEFFSSDSKKIIPLIGDIFTQSSLPEPALEREKSALIAAIEESREKPLAEAFRHSRALLFGPNGYGLTRSGDHASLAGIDSDLIRSHCEAHLTASNTVISAFGSFEPDELLEQLENAFSSTHQGTSFTPQRSTMSTGKSQRVTLDKEQAALAISFPTKGLSDHAATTPLELIDAYTSDMSGPLFVRLREELGLAYSVGSNLWHGIDGGMLSFYIATSPEQLTQAREELLSEIEKLASSGIPDSVFQATQTSLIARTELANQSSASRAQQSAVDTLMGFSADHHRHHADLISAQSPDDIKEIAQEILSQAPTIVEVSPTQAS